MLPVATAYGQSTSLPRFLPGQVVTVDVNQQLAHVMLYSHVSSTDAPGKVPDEMAQQAAALSVQASHLESKGKIANARRLRQHIAELLRWRSIDLTISTSGTPLIGLQRLSVDQIALHMRLHASVSVASALADGVTPDKAVLMKDAIQVSKRVTPIIRRLPAVQHAGSTFFDIIGEVVQVNPLILAVQDKTIQIDTPPQFACVQQVPITARALAPGQCVFARVTMENELKVTAMNRLLIMFTRSDLPLEQADLVD